MSKMQKIMLIVLAVCGSALAQPWTVQSHQKISDAEGGFTGSLDDIDHLGRAVASIGDLDGDGVTDMAVGASADDDGGSVSNTNKGAVWILFMNTDGTVKSHQKISATEGNFGGNLDNSDEFGYSMACIGDLDGDEVVDLAVGTWGDDDGGGEGRGALWILFLNTDGTVKNYQKISDTQGGFTGVLDNADRFSNGIGSLGDLNNDGIEDIAVGAYGDDDGGGYDKGAVWILFLDTDGTVKSHQKISATQGNFLGGLDDADVFGGAISSLGDLDGDGVTDIAVGATGDDDGGDHNGAVWILFLNPDGTVKDYQKISSTQGGFTGVLDGNDALGGSMTLLGDLDGDGVVDIGAGAYNDDDGGTNRGAVWILFLNSDGTVKSQQKISDTQGGFTGDLDNEDRFGVSVALLSDPDGSEPVVLAVGAFGDDDGGTDRGAVWVLFLEGVEESPETYHVDGATGDNTNDGLSHGTAFKTIQKGIVAADDGDTVLVWPGVYAEDVSFLGKAITVQSAADAAVIQAVSNYGVSFVTGEGAESVLGNCVIRNSYAGIHAVGSSPTIRQVTVVNNLHGIIADLGAEPTISNSILWNNTNGDLFDCTASYSCMQDPIVIGEPSIPGGISYWKFDEGSNIWAFDSMGTNHGYIDGATWATGKIDGALSFDGVDDYVDLGNDSSLKPPLPVTISAWIKLLSIDTPVTQQIFTTDEYPVLGTYYGIRFGVLVSDELFIAFGDGDPTWSHRFKTGTSFFNTDIWYHVVGVIRGGSDMDLYINGVDDGGSYNGDGGNLAYSSSNASIGSRGGTDAFFDGNIDDVRIFDRSLTSTEVGQLYLYGVGDHGNINADPMFVDPAEDFHLFSERGRYMPLDPNEGLWVLDEVTSPCIDAGDPTIDPANERMPNGARINMGAYGDSAYAGMSEWPVAGDVNRDGVFNLIDFALISDDWMWAAPWAE